MSMLDEMKAAGGEGYPAVKFDKKGDGYTGTLISLPVKKALPDKFHPGQTKETFLYNVQLADGEKRTVFNDKYAQIASLTKAYADAGLADFELGDEISEQFYEEAPSDKGNPQKLFRAKVVRKASSVGVADVFGQEAY